LVNVLDFDPFNYIFMFDIAMGWEEIVSIGKAFARRYF
jgi:hypothetical protein